MVLLDDARSSDDLTVSCDLLEEAFGLEAGKGVATPSAFAILAR